jgi:hypothetical protein
MIFEDAHWADPSSIELLDQTITRIRRMPVLAVVTFRPEFAPPWTGHTQVTSLMLNPLTPKNSAGLVLQTAGGAMIDPVIVDEIVDRADGVPLFVEELTKAILEVGNAEASRASGVLGAPTTVPPALFASLTDCGQARTSPRSAPRSDASSPTNCSPPSQRNPKASCGRRSNSS